MTAGHSPVAIQRRATLLLTLIAISLFAASLLYNGWRLKRGSEAVLTSTTEAMWSAYQAEYELQRLLSALQAYALGAQESSLAEVRKRFDVLWSKLVVFRKGSDSALIRQATPIEELLPEYFVRLSRIEHLIGRVRDDPRAYEEVEKSLHSMAASLHRVLLATDREVARRHALLDQEVHRLSRRNDISLIGLIGGAALLVFLLYREIRRTQALLEKSHAQERRVHHLAHHDMLTGLPNRRLFEERLQQVLARNGGTKGPVALMLLDLDRFKEINDCHGHAVGDALLRAVAKRMRACMRSSDLLARIGGDEFAVIQDGVSDTDIAVRLAERVQASLRSPFELDGVRTLSTVSIGIAFASPGGCGPEALLKSADLALYRAKAGGRNRVILHSPELASEA